MAHDPMLCNIPCLLFDIIIDEEIRLVLIALKIPLVVQERQRNSVTKGDACYIALYNVLRCIMAVDLSLSPLECCRSRRAVPIAGMMYN